MRVFQIQDDWGLDHLRLATRADPVPGPGDVLLAMKASSLNYRDLVVPRRGYGSQTGALPLIPISDGVGEVVALGPGVAGLAVGDHVCPAFFPFWQAGEPTRARLASLGGPLDGTMAELMRVPAAGVAKVPDHLTDVEAATLPCAALTAWNATVGYVGVRPGDRVLVQGCGGVALFALQFAKLAGAHVTVISSSGERLARARALGADAGIDYRATPDWAKASREVVGDRGYDLIVELGGEKTLPQSLRCIRPGGTIALIGVLSGSAMDASLGHVVTRRVRLQGITCGSGDDFAAMLEAIGRHRLRPVVDRVFPFEALKDALAWLATGAQFGKIAIAH